MKQEQRQQPGAERDRLEQDVLVRRMGSGAFRTEPVEHGDAHGADDVPVGAAAALVDGIRGVREVVFEHSSHTPVLEESGRYLEVVGEFLRDAESAS